MVNVAIAGGNGNVGRTIVEVLAGQTRHKCFILTRKTSNADSDSTATTISVDYNDIAALTSILEANKIHVIISAFGMNATSLAVSQANLIRAAEASSITKRFIPSSFASKYLEEDVPQLPPLQTHFDSLKLLEKTNLEWATVNNGMFLDYYAPPSLKSNMHDGLFVIDIQNNAAAIPGTGNELVTFTYSYDVAKFIVAALDLPTWPQEHELNIVGDTISYNDFVKLIEEARGVKIDVVYDDLENLRKGAVTLLPGHEKQFGK